MSEVILTREDAEAFKWPESCKSDPTISSAYLELAKFIQELEETMENEYGTNN